MMTLTWIKCDTDWCPLQTVNLENVTAAGVYIIWHGGDNARVVYVGQGDIKARLEAHRQDAAILAYRQYGLFVTWASVPAQSLDGVERYLAEKWKPLVGERHPAAAPIAVNSPFG